MADNDLLDMLLQAAEHLNHVDVDDVDDAEEDDIDVDDVDVEDIEEDDIDVDDADVDAEDVDAEDVDDVEEDEDIEEDDKKINVGVTDNQYSFLREKKAIMSHLIKFLKLSIEYSDVIFKKYFLKMGIHKDIWNIGILNPALQEYSNLNDKENKPYIDNFESFMKFENQLTDNKCPISNCSSRHKVLKNIKRHYLSHFKLIVCEICGMCFGDRSNFGRHSIVHSGGGELFKCPKCGATYTRKSNLNAHLEKNVCENPSYVRRVNR